MRITHEDGGAGGGRPAEETERSVARAIGRGSRGRCPACGTGPVFDGYLEVAPACTVCGEVFSGHRADDLPPYLTIVVVGHVVVSGLLISEKLWQPELWLTLTIWLSVAASLTLLLLRPIKGGVVGLQWALRLHGFARPAPRSEAGAPPLSSPTPETR